MSVGVEEPSLTSVVAANLDRVRDRVRAAGGDPRLIRLVAVTKALGPDTTRAALAAGVVDLGENYAQELVAKHLDLAEHPQPDGVVPTWHFLGRLQTNKVRALAPIVSLWQSVDRSDLVREIAKRAPGASILIQVNAGGEAHKGGCRFDEVQALVTQAQNAGLDVPGLMAVGVAEDAAATRLAFRRVVGMADELGLAHKSIGMSNDLEIAVQEGATMIRIGRDLFGDRPERPAP